MQLIEVKEVLAYLCYGGNIDGNVRDDSEHELHEDRGMLTV